MRWTYLITRLVFVASVWAFLAFGLDPLLRHSVVLTLQSMTGAKADVGLLSTKFFPPTVTLTNVALASASRPGKNIVEFDQLHFSLEPSSLSRRRFVVEEGRLQGVRFDTHRNDDGQLGKSPEPVHEEPSWMSEKFTELGDEWLTSLTEQVKAQLDPNVLETYRIGTQMYEKWDAHFLETSSRAKTMKPRVQQLRVQFQKAREGDTLQQIEQFIQVAERAEQIVLEIQQFREELTGIVPEVRADFQQLHEARQRDQEKVMHTLSLLKPDARRISQALLGKTIYRQVQQTLTWIQAAREYQNELHEQVQPPRGAGRDFEFLVRNPAPDFLLKKLALSGQISVNEELIPFSALVSDVTEDPKLLGRPCVMRLRADGTRPLQLRATWDATGNVPVAELLADFRDTNRIPLQVGKPQQTCVTATLRDLSWTTQLRLIGDQMDGNIKLASGIDNLHLEAETKVRPEIIEAANDAFSAVQVLNASVSLGGTLKQPELELQSDVGEQISEGIRLAFANQLDRARERMLTEVNAYAGDQIGKLKGRFSGEYERLMTENRELLDQANEVKSIVASLRSGKADPSTLVRQVTNSRLIPEKEQKKINRVMGEFEETLQGGSLPSGLQEKLPPQLSGGLPLPGNFRRPTPDGNPR